mmetsp:Transcript_9184/g.16030  ORF Transcript_9184/g.16030 Transcript_9184/m.16030 type:complete len:255 (+) Transcript_9184:182-946(+)
MAIVSVDVLGFQCANVWLFVFGIKLDDLHGLERLTLLWIHVVNAFLNRFPFCLILGLGRSDLFLDPFLHWLCKLLCVQFLLLALLFNKLIHLIHLPIILENQWLAETRQLQHNIDRGVLLLLIRVLAIREQDIWQDIVIFFHILDGHILQPRSSSFALEAKHITGTRLLHLLGESHRGHVGWQDRVPAHLHRLHGHKVFLSTLHRLDPERRWRWLFGYDHHDDRNREHFASWVLVRDDELRLRGSEHVDHPVHG